MTTEPLTRDELRQELSHYATKADLSDLKAEMHALESRLTRWMVGLMLAAAAVAATIAGVMTRLAG